MFGHRISFIKVIGKGGFGTVYLAEIEDRNHFRRRIAVKILNEQYQEISQAIARHQDEARLLGMLHHDNIVQVYDLGKINEQPAVFMEYVEGVSLSQLLKQETLPPKIVFELIADCAGALDAAYNSKNPQTKQPLCVIHRDIKPSNILLSKSGVVKILDFGIARANFDRESRTQTNQLGTARYMAPEQWLENRSSEKVDIYALGFSMLEMLHGRLLQRLPLDPQLHQQTLKGYLDLDLPFNSIIPTHILLSQMLSFEPQKRPSAKAVRDACLSLTENLSGSNAHLYAKEKIPPLLKAQEDSVTHIPLPKKTRVTTIEKKSTTLFWPIVALCLAIVMLLTGNFSEDSTTVSPPTVSSMTNAPLPQAEPILKKDTVATSTTETVSSPKKSARKKVSAKPKVSPSTQMIEVSFSSIPLGAEVWIDGSLAGTTLLRMVSLPIGQRKVELRWGDKQIQKDIIIGAQSSKRFVWKVEEEKWNSYLD